MQSRRDFLQTAGLGLASAMAGCSPGAPEPQRPNSRRPNIILVMADDLGYETLGCYGGASHHTPHLDRLAAEGIRFDHAYAQPLCTPTRVQLMTGQYNFRNWTAFGMMDPQERTFGHMMSEAGYRTCISGKWQLWSYNPPEFEPHFRGLGMKPEDAGFDEWYLWHARHTEAKGSRYADPVILDNGTPVEQTGGAYGPDLYTAYITSFLERHVDQHADQPFFVYYPMALPHGPFNPTPHSAQWAEGDRHESDAQEYFGGMVDYMDIVVGRIVDKVDQLGIRDDTLILFFGDNGSPKGTRAKLGDQWIEGGKGLPTDAGTHEPMIANWPGSTPAGTINDDLIDSTDFFPTLAELAGVSLPAGPPLDGISFAPQLRGQPGAPKDVILCWHDPRPGWGKENYTQLDLWARDKRFKLYDDGRLYDVAADPLEQDPIAEGDGPPAARAARAKLAAALNQVPADKRDPLWDPYKAFGPV